MGFFRRHWWGVVLLAALAPACGGGGGGPSFAILALGLPGQPAAATAAVDVAGGEDLMILGVGFEAGATVRFDATPAGNVTFVSATELHAMTPALPEGAVDIVVTNPDGTETRIPGGVIFDIPPTVATVVALAGPTAGAAEVPVDTAATDVEVSGADFEDGAAVLVDGIAAPTTFVDANTVRFAAPLRIVEADVDIAVRNPAGHRGTLADGLFYTQERSLAPYPNAQSEEELRHLLRRAGFDAPEADLAVFRQLGRVATVDRLMAVVSDAAVQQVEADALQIYGAEPPPAGINARTNQEWYITLMRDNPHPFQERLCFFLHDHFATSQDAFGQDERWWMHEQIKLFRRFPLPVAQGGLDYDWRALLIEICKDRAMLEWLNQTDSTRNNPNENFARELWELFMLGEGNGYVQADIEEASKAFTGFRDEDVPDAGYEEMTYYPDRHDEREKTIFGVTGFFGYDSISPFHEDGPGIETDLRDTDGGIVALTLAERPVEASTFICRKIAEYFMADDPAPELVDGLAQTLRNSDWNLRPVFRQLLLSKAMYSRRARKEQIKDPVDYVLDFVRSTGVDVTPSRLRSALATLEQEPLEPPDVDGWPRNNAWMGGQAMLERINFLRDVVRDLDDTPTQIHPLVPPAGQRSPAELVDHIAAMLDVELTATARTELVAYVTSTLDAGDNVIPFAFDPDDDTDLRMKARGLLYLIAQYHDAHRR